LAIFRRLQARWATVYTLCDQANTYGLAAQRPPQRVTRLLAGSTYAVLGYGALREPGPPAGEAATLMAAIRKKVPLPVQDEQVVQVNGALQAACGVLLALGTAPRLAALVLASTTLAAHRFWTAGTQLAARQQQAQFHMNMAMIGGLLFAVLD
jgi:putative oxidoreductase